MTVSKSLLLASYLDRGVLYPYRYIYVGNWLNSGEHRAVGRVKRQSCLP